MDPTTHSKKIKTAFEKKLRTLNMGYGSYNPVWRV
jgi:hypothetical protein